MGLIKRHRLLVGVLSFIFIVLPGVIDAVWSLAERFGKVDMTDFPISWLTAATAPIGLIMLGIIIWQLKRERTKLSQGNALTKVKDDAVLGLQRECRHLSQEILQFLSDRQRAEPDLPSSKRDWHKRTNESIRCHQETVSLYHQRFGARVIALYETLKEIGHSDSELDFFYEHPTNALGIREVGQRLGALGERLG